MMQQLCANTERANASAARVVDVASAPFGNSVKGFTTTGNTTLDNAAWIAMPVHTPAICTHGKRYERRLQEMLT